MPFVSVTRLHLRSRFFLLPFLIASLRSTRQARRTPGFLMGAVGNDLEQGSWTLTSWRDVESMRSFRNTGAHMKAMPRLLSWCDEASYAHWSTESNALPTAEEAYNQLK